MLRVRSVAVVLVGVLSACPRPTAGDDARDAGSAPGSSTTAPNSSATSVPAPASSARDGGTVDAASTSTGNSGGRASSAGATSLAGSRASSLAAFPSSSARSVFSSSSLGGSGGLDAGTGADAACQPHAGLAETGVPCGSSGVACGTPATCCGGYGGARCETTCNPITQAPILCDGPEDCTVTGEICCGSLTLGMSCLPALQCHSGGSGLYDDVRLCNATADCPNPLVCNGSTALRPFAGTAVGGCVAACQ